MATDRAFASASVARHLLRGAVGFGSLIGGIALAGSGWLTGLLLVPVGLVALRGCPTCWAVGLLQTVSMGRLKRSCVDGRCEVTRR